MPNKEIYWSAFPFPDWHFLFVFKDILKLKTPIVALYDDTAAWHVFMLFLFSIEIQIAKPSHVSYTKWRD